MRARTRFACGLRRAPVCSSESDSSRGAHLFPRPHTLQYQNGEEVTVWVNKIGPFHNPQETYEFDSLGLCRDESKSLKTRSDGFGAMLQGDNLQDSGLNIKFKADVSRQSFCKMRLDGASLEQLSQAVEQHYWYQMFIDDLPVWGMLGELMASGDGGEEQAFIYTHRSFSISWNHRQIIEINLTSENPVALKDGVVLDFTYSVKWTSTRKAFAQRFDRYLDNDFFEHKIHWFSIFNSIMMVVFLCGLVSLILMRVLRSDYARYSVEEDIDDIDRIESETGWKQVHNDVFRAPPFFELYAALVGTGYQLFVLVFTAILAALLGSLYTSRGSMLSMILVCYVLTSFVCGYASGSIYKRYAGRAWKATLMLAAILLPGAVLGMTLALNMVAVMYESQAAVSLRALFAIAAIWLFISCPLLLLGTIVGRNTTEASDFPCRPTTSSRPIPGDHWYTHPLTLAVGGGILPFGSIFIEMYYVFTSFWNYKFYYVYGFLFLVYCILTVVTMCVTIVCTYFLLNAEDYRWHWTSFMAGGSTAAYVFLYAVYFFFNKTHMYGVMQTAFYFGYTAVFCFGLFILTGTIAYIGTSTFVHKIYGYIKSD